MSEYQTSTQQNRITLKFYKWIKSWLVLVTTHKPLLNILFFEVNAICKQNYENRHWRDYLQAGKIFLKVNDVQLRHHYVYIYTYKWHKVWKRHQLWFHVTANFTKHTQNVHKEDTPKHLSTLPNIPNPIIN